MMGDLEKNDLKRITSERNDFEKNDFEKIASERNGVSKYENLKLEKQLCFPMYACARRVTGLYAPYLKPLGITYTQYLVFLVLWENDGVCVSDLCRRLYLDSGTLTPLLKKLEEKGFLKRCRCQDDERCVKVFLTDAGEQMREQAAGIPEQIGCCVELEQEEKEVLYGLLYKILGNV